MVVALVVAACGGSDSTTTSGATSGAAPAATTAPAGSTAAAAPDANVSGTVSMAGVWTGDEQKNFQAVLDGFKKQYPERDRASTTRPATSCRRCSRRPSQGGKPPDMAAVAQPGLMRDFQAQGELKPIDYAKDAIAGGLRPELDRSRHRRRQAVRASPSRRPTSRPSGTTSRRSRTRAWSRRRRGTSCSTDSDDAAGVRACPAYSIGGADGWTLTDLFENIYLRQAGPDMYDKLATHDDPVDRPVGQGRADDDGEDRGRHAEHRRRHVGRARRPTSRSR